MSALRHLAIGAGIALLCSCQSSVEQGPADDRADLFDQAPMGKTSLGLELDLLNTFAYALWTEGALNANFDERLLDEELESNLSFLRDLNLWLDLSSQAMLPPVVDITDRGISITIGELEVDLVGGTDLGQLAARAVIAVEAEIEFSIQQGVLRMASHVDEGDIHIDLKIEAFAGLKSEAVEEIVLGITPGFVKSMTERLATLPVPSLALNSAGIDRVLGLQEASLALSADGAILSGKLADIDPTSVFERASIDRAPIEETAPTLSACAQADDPAQAGLQGDCCFSDAGAAGICTNLDPDGDGVEESFCPSGEIALRLKCPWGDAPVKCCIYP